MNEPRTTGVAEPTTDRFVRQVSFEAETPPKALRKLADWADAQDQLIETIHLDHSEETLWCRVHATLYTYGSAL